MKESCELVLGVVGVSRSEQLSDISAEEKDHTEEDVLVRVLCRVRL